MSKNKNKGLTFDLFPVDDTSRNTGAIIGFLNNNGWEVWRNNTYGVYDRKKGSYRALQYQQKGVSDIIGFRKSDGLIIAVEIKTGSDRISEFQSAFLRKVKKANGLAMIAHDFNDFLAKYERRQKQNLLPKSINHESKI